MNIEKLSGFERKDFSLRELLSYQNPNQKEYEDLVLLERERIRIERGGKPPAPDSYTHVYRELIRRLGGDEPEEEEGIPASIMYKEQYRFFHEKLREGILVDLGSGWNKEVPTLAKTTKASIYIGVDAYLTDSETLDPYNVVDQGQLDMTISMHIQADMLDFVSRLKSDSVNISINGIDYFIVHSSDYHKALGKEIQRVTKLGGIAFGVNSDALWDVDEQVLKPAITAHINDRMQRILEKEKNEQAH